MRKSILNPGIGLIVILVIVTITVLFPFHHQTASDILSAYSQVQRYGRATMEYPLDGTLFPPEIVSARL